MKPPMLHTAYKLTTSRNVYGDFTYTGETAIKCHFRYITEHISGENQESIESDAMIWCEPDSGVDREDIIKFDDEYWRVERVIKARRLRSTAVQFIKCELLRYRTIS